LIHHHLASGDIESLTKNISWDVEDFALSDDEDRIAWVVNEGGIGQIWMDRMNGSVLEHRFNLLDVPRGVISGIKFRPNSHEIGFSLSTARESADAYSHAGPYLQEDGAKPVGPGLTRWTASETGGLDTRTFLGPMLVEYPSFNGRKVPAFVYRPPPHKFPGPRPVLIDIHGGSEGQFRPAFLGRLNYWINEMGIVVIFPNVRGSAGYGKTYLKLDNGMKRDDSVKDIGALLD
jgi:dipeptidyl aminopeptidase/acylaminoacyl peptidase